MSALSRVGLRRFRAGLVSLIGPVCLTGVTWAQGPVPALPPGAEPAPMTLPQVVPASQPGLDVDGTAFYPQPNAVVSEVRDPLAPICCQEPRFFVRAEYLLWNIKSGPLPLPIATTSILNPPPITGSVGRLGEPDTLIVLGNTDLQFGTFSGLRLNAGYVLNPESGLSLEASGFLLERRSDNNFAIADASGNPLLAIPVVNVLSGQEGRAIYGFPGEFLGGIGITSGARLWGLEFNGALRSLWERNGIRIDALAGFRYLDLNENVGIGASTFIIGDSFLSTYRDIVLGIGDTIITQDDFAARNQFYGGQLGLRAETTFGRFFVQGLAKIALGGTRQKIDVQGLTTVVASGALLQDLGGVFASPTNIGRITRSEFSVVPELGINIGWQLNEAVRVAAGYSIIWWTNVARPGDQIDRVVNPTYLPTTRDFSVTPFGEIRPQVTGNQSDFWVHGVNFSLEIRF